VRENYYAASSKKAVFVGVVMLGLLPGAALAQGQPQSGGFVNPFAWLFQASAPQCIPDVPDPSIYTRCTLATARGQQVCRCDLAHDTDPKDRETSVSTVSIGPISVGGTTTSSSSSSSSSNTTATPIQDIITTVSITPDDPIATPGKQKGNNGIGNGVDPQPPGDPKVNDGPGEQPGNN
jgi:hypothetical protein